MANDYQLSVASSSRHLGSNVLFELQRPDGHRVRVAVPESTVLKVVGLGLAAVVTVKLLSADKPTRRFRKKGRRA